MITPSPQITCTTVLSLIDRLKACQGVDFDTSTRILPGLIYDLEVYSEDQNFKALLIPKAELDLYAQQYYESSSKSQTLMGIDIYTDKYAKTVFKLSSSSSFKTSLLSDSTAARDNIFVYIDPPAYAEGSCLRCTEPRAKISRVIVWWHYNYEIGKEIKAVTVGCI